MSRLYRLRRTMAAASLACVYLLLNEIEELEELEELERRRNIPRRVFRTREDAFALQDDVFLEKFRLNKSTVLLITDKIKHHLPKEGYSPHLRVLIALRFFGSGSYQQTIAGDSCLCVNKSTVNENIINVSKALIANLLGQINFPNAEEQESLKKAFSKRSGMPGMVGAVDTTQICIKCPAEDSPRSRRHSYYKNSRYSINVQVISDDKLLIRGLNAKFPASVEDSHIWRMSGIRDIMVAQYQNGITGTWLLGDNEYPLEPWLMTPISTDLEKPGSPEEAYNLRHRVARTCVRRCISLLKSRFPCLSKRRVLKFTPTQSSCITIACSILHNICIKRGLVWKATHREEETDDEEEEMDDIDEEEEEANEGEAGNNEEDLFDEESEDDEEFNFDEFVSFHRREIEVERQAEQIRSEVVKKMKRMYLKHRVFPVHCRSS